MNNASHYDYLIVGQGLAGSAMAIRLCSRGYRILVLDGGSKNSASEIAAGLYNPVTGKNMAKTWLADEIFDALEIYYFEVERLTGKKFFFPTPLYRPFRTVEEQNDWMSRSADRTYGDFIEHISVTPVFQDKINDHLGGVMLKKTGYVNTAVYLDAVRDYLISKGAFEKQDFAYDDLRIHGNSVGYHHITAGRIIFCQGIHNQSNPWFGNLPIISLKGETLTIQCDWRNDVILNRGVYVVPGDRVGEWRVGATYHLKDQSEAATTEARTELTDKLNDLVLFPYSITGQQWGFRPTTRDRKPILGAHAKYSPLIIFNGLGTKGVAWHLIFQQY